VKVDQNFATLRFKRAAIGALVIAALCTGATYGTAQASVIDQVNLPAHNALLNDAFVVQQQQVTAGISGTLAGIDLFYDFLGNGSDSVSVGLGALGPTGFSGSFAFSATVSPTAVGANFIDTSAANINLNAGDKFVIQVLGFVLSAFPSTGIEESINPYAGGDLIRINGPSVIDETTDGQGISLAFETFVNPPSTGAVPEPASLGLFGAGLAGLGWLRRRSGKSPTLAAAA